MTSQCPRCATPRVSDYPFCGTCGLDFRAATPATPTQEGLPPQQQLPPEQGLPAQQPNYGAPQQATAQVPPQPYQTTAPGPGATPGICPRCNAPLYPGYTQCGNCGFDSRAPWGAAAPAAGSKSRILPIALAVGLVVVLLGAGAVVLAVQPKGNSASSPSSGSSARVDASGTTLTSTTPSTPIPGRTQTPGAQTPPQAGAWEGTASNGLLTVLFTVDSSGTQLFVVMVGYVDSKGSVHMWMAATMVVVNGSFDDTLESIIGQSGDAFRLHGTFASANQAFGTYTMTVLGVEQTGQWTAAPTA